MCRCAWHTQRTRLLCCCCSRRRRRRRWRQVHRGFLKSASSVKLEPNIAAFPKLSYHSTSAEAVTLVNHGERAISFSLLKSSHASFPAYVLCVGICVSVIL